MHDRVIDFCGRKIAALVTSADAEVSQHREDNRITILRLGSFTDLPAQRQKAAPEIVRNDVAGAVLQTQ
ncbi:hypothetical protein JMJ55_29370 [Belnapia sp. T6]|uniref:Uncharacterized protein n=1 Tax=Belnapia mucosa TaxID=2804532 RepID=A0ABS1VG76_9PROT|nr:hypothetical protein [Belnapia mucosa]MBL6459428.1 hypothetical protein [Belnapia mucosa]